MTILQGNPPIHCNLYQNTNSIFMELEQIILKSLWNYIRLLIAKTNLKTKNKAGGIMHPVFKL